jgi:hypothetical protein
MQLSLNEICDTTVLSELRFWQKHMQLSLSSNADKLIAQMMALGFEDPAMLVEVALERMAQEELAESEEDSPEYIEWVRSEVAIGIEQLDREEFSPLTPKEIRAEVLAAYQNRHPNA